MAPTVRSMDWKFASQVLGGEATHFTPWLAANLHLLGDALGIEGLVLEGTEHDISGKRLEVLAAVGVESDGETVGVAIENQYGMSEHGHLGQLITYVAGVSASYDRVLGVWLVDSVHPAHEAAIELLNRETTDRLGFVLARPRFAQLGDNDYGVHFEVAVQPNEFIKSERKKSVASNAERAEFLSQLLATAGPAIREAGFKSMGMTHKGYSVDISWGSSKWRIHVRAGDALDGFRAMIYVNGYETTAQNEALLAEFTVHADLIEAELHSPHTFDTASHLGSTNAKKAAIASCRWPGFGYQSDVDTAAVRLTEFARGVAAAVKASGH